MKPFDLEAALRGEKVVTIAGQDVSQLRLFNATNEDYPLCGVVDGKVKGWGKDGRYYITEDRSRFDLFMAEEEKQPVVRYKWAYFTGTCWDESESFYTDEEVKKHFKGYKIKRLDYTRTEFEE